MQSVNDEQMSRHNTTSCLTFHPVFFTQKHYDETTNHRKGKHYNMHLLSLCVFHSTAKTTYACNSIPAHTNGVNVLYSYVCGCSWTWVIQHRTAPCGRGQNTRRKISLDVINLGGCTAVIDVKRDCLVFVAISFRLITDGRRVCMLKMTCSVKPCLHIFQEILK